MTIEDELTLALITNIPSSDTKERNIEIIKRYFGFGKSPAPTYEELSNTFGFAKGQRVGQIIKADFRSRVQPEDLPSLRRVNQIFSSRHHWPWSVLNGTLQQSGLVLNPYSIQGILKLMSHFDSSDPYEIYTTELKPLPKAEHAQKTDFILQKSMLPEISKLYNIVRNAPGQNGIANLATVLGGIKDGERHRQLIIELIMNSYDTWFNEDRGDFWYVFEKYGKNRIRNFNKKVFSVVDSCETEPLIEAYYNCLSSLRKGKSSSGRKYMCPPKHVLRQYLNQSTQSTHAKGRLSFVGEVTTLNPIEEDVVECFVEKDYAKYDELKQYLLSKDHNMPYIDANVFKSFMIYKSGHRPEISYSFVGRINQETRYDRIHAKLKNLPSTEIERLTSGRAEQRLLRLWLFMDNEHGRRGLCGDIFSSKALVAAHKKPRTECDEHQKRDPSIVMPMCVFGCDSLYERGHVWIQNGFVAPGLPVETDGPEKELVAKLIGRKIDDKWLKGPNTYFKNPLDLAIDVLG